MKQKIILSCILIAWILAAIVILSSCNIIKQVNKSRTDSTSVQHHDSASTTTADLSKYEGSSTTDYNGLEVDLFGSGDTCELTKDTSNSIGSDIGTKENISIKPNKEGGYDIESNIPIKSIKTKNSKTTEQHKDTSSKVTNSTITHVTDSTHLDKKVKIKDIETKPGLSLFKWIGVIVMLGLCVYIAGKIYLYFNPEATGVFALFAGWRRKKEA